MKITISHTPQNSAVTRCRNWWEDKSPTSNDSPICTSHHCSTAFQTPSTTEHPTKAWSTWSFTAEEQSGQDKDGIKIPRIANCSPQGKKFLHINKLTFLGTRLFHRVRMSQWSAKKAVIVELIVWTENFPSFAQAHIHPSDFPWKGETAWSYCYILSNSPTSLPLGSCRECHFHEKVEPTQLNLSRTMTSFSTFKVSVSPTTTF